MQVSGYLSRVHLTRALDASLRRLGSDYIDLYQCHNWSAGPPVEETMSTLDGFVRSGKVRYLGCSNYTVGQIVECQWASQRVGGTPFTSLQPHYSLLARQIEAEILPACARHGLGTLTYGPLGGGILAGRYQRGVNPETGSRLDSWLGFPHAAASEWARTLLRDRSFDIADQVAAVAAQLGATATAVAIAWTAGRPGVTSVIVGPHTTAQLAGNLAGFDLDLPPELDAQLTGVSAPPNGPVTGMPVALSAA
jgi:aryl-alcohol dehydrogenase-like predicted oxidoreductase